MSSLTLKDKSALAQLLEQNGYVLDFSDRTFGDFFGDFDVFIHDEKYQKHGTSKAKKLRAFFEMEPDPLVGMVIKKLVDRASEIYKESEVSQLIGQCREIGQRLMAGKVNLDGLKETFKYDSQYLASQIKRLEEAVENDPALEIGTAKELVETICKTILKERGKPVEGHPDVSELTKLTLKDLNLVPETIPKAAKGRDDIKLILSNLGAIVKGLADLRNLYGTGHGAEASAKGLSRRHAKLAAGAAATWVTFLFDTHTETL